MWGCYPPLCLPHSPPLLSLAFSVYLCANVGPRGLLVVRLPARSSHTPPVLVLPQPRESSPPWCPSLPLLPVWMNVFFLSPWCRTSLSLDFSVSSGCARGRSVFTDTIILVLLPIFPFFNNYFHCTASKFHKWRNLKLRNLDQFIPGHQVS